MHCLSHHSYPNTLLDYEIQALEPVVYYLRILPKNTILKGVIKEAIFPLTTLLNIVLKLIIVPLQRFKQPEWFYLVPLLQLPLLYLETGQWDIAWRLFVVMHLSVSYAFMKLTFLGHRTGREWTEGNREIRDFAEHQIVASTDTKTNDLCGVLSYVGYAGFNFHAVHHIFPTIDNHFLPAIDKMLT
jgi:fatty acid desaturase